MSKTPVQTLASEFKSFFQGLGNDLPGKVIGTSLPMIGTAKPRLNSLVTSFKQVGARFDSTASFSTFSGLRSFLTQELKSGGFDATSILTNGTSSTGYSVTLDGKSHKAVSVKDTLSSNLGLDSKFFDIGGSHTVVGSDTLGFHLAFKVDSLGHMSWDVNDPSSVDIAFRDKLPSTALTGRVGFLNGTIQEDSLKAAVDGLNADVKFNIGSNGKASTVKTTGSFTVNAKVATNKSSDYLPSLNAGLSVDWTFGQEPLVKLLDANADLGKLFGKTGIIHDFASGIKKVTDPLAPIAKTLTEDLPLIDQLGISATPIDVLSQAGVLDSLQADKLKTACHAINSANLIATDLETLTSAGSLQLGSYTVKNFTYAKLPGVRNDAPASAVSLIPDGDIPELPVSLQKLNENLTGMETARLGSFSMPLLTDAPTIAGLLVSQTTDLLKWSLPQLSVEANINLPDIPTPIPAVYLNIGGAASANVNLGVGYDTSGITNYQKGRYQDPSKLLDGLYLYEPQHDTPLFGASLSFKPGVSLDAVVASAAVTGSLTASFSSALSDDKGYLFQEGKFNTNLGLSNTIALSAGLNASLTLGWPPFGYTDEYTLIPEQTLWSKSWSTDSSTVSQGSGLERYKSDLTFEDFYSLPYPNDGKSDKKYELLFASTDRDGYKMALGTQSLINQIGAGSTYQPHKVWISKGQDDAHKPNQYVCNISMDSLGSRLYYIDKANPKFREVLSDKVDQEIISSKDSPFILDVTQKQNPSNNYRDIVFGGTGNDTIRTYNDNNVLYGGGGNNQITALGKNNLIYSGVGHDTIIGSSNSKNILNFSPATSPLIYDETNAVAKGDSSLQGCAQYDSIVGQISEIIGTSYNDSMVAKENMILDGGAGNDTIWAWYYPDHTSQGNKHLLIGGTGSDLVKSQEWGNDTLVGVDLTESPASLRGNGEHDTLQGDVNAMEDDHGTALYVLGDSAGSFYMGPQGGEAKIYNFNQHYDNIQLAGSESNYSIDYPGGDFFRLTATFNGQSHIIAYINGDFGDDVSQQNQQHILDNAIYKPLV